MLNRRMLVKKTKCILCTDHNSSKIPAASFLFLNTVRAISLFAACLVLGFGCTTNMKYSSSISKGDDLSQAEKKIAASNEYRKAIELDPFRPEARLKLAAIYLNQDRLEEALSELNFAGEALDRSYSKYSPEQIATLRSERFSLLAILSEKNNLSPEAKKYRELCRAIDPKNKSCQDYDNAIKKQQDIRSSQPSTTPNQAQSGIAILIDRESLPEKTALSFVIVSGLVKAEYPIQTVKVAGMEAIRLEATSSGEPFAGVVQLRPGQNIISINATDDHNNQKRVEAIIQRQIENPQRGALLILANSEMSDATATKRETLSIYNALINSIPANNIYRIMDEDVTTEKMQSSIIAFTKQSQFNELLVYIDIPARSVRIGNEKRTFWLPFDAKKSDVAGTGISLSRLVPPALISDGSKKIIFIANTDKTESLLTEDEKIKYAESGSFFLCGARPTKLTSSPALLDSKLFEQSIARVFMNSAGGGNIYELLYEASSYLRENSRGEYELISVGSARSAEQYSLGRNIQREVQERERYLFLLSEFATTSKISQFAVANIGGILMKGTNPNGISRAFKLIDALVHNKIPTVSIDKEVRLLMGETQ